MVSMLVVLAIAVLILSSATVLHGWRLYELDAAYADDHRRLSNRVSAMEEHVGMEVNDDFPRNFARAVSATFADTPSAEAREKIKKNCEGCQRSAGSKVSFRGPSPVETTEETV